MKRAVGALSLIAGLTSVTAVSAAEPARLEQGHAVYQYWCASCHSGDLGFLGKDSLPGTLALSLKYKGQKPAVLDERTDLTKELVKYVVRHSGDAEFPQD